MARTRKSITTKPDTAPQAAQNAGSETVPVSVRVASVSGLVRAKVRAVGAWYADPSGRNQDSLRSDPNDSA